ncbi:MAG: ABC transporter substrate-binding protein [Gammaproteobacteria bacterium]|nr:ABC transporter substrate-binding protein [Gammaproteobacteria bacterium]
MKYKRLLNLALFVCLLPSIFSCSQSQEPIKIGAIIPLTGKASQHASIAEGMELAIDEVNRLGGINGHPLEMILIDSETDPEAAKRAFAKIESESQPHLYVSSTSAVTLALAPLAEKSQVVLTGLVVSSPQFPLQQEWSFKYYNSSSGEFRPILSLVTDKGIERLGVIYQNDAYGTATLKAVKDMTKESGITIYSQPFETKQSDISKEVAKLSELEAILVIGFVKNTAKVLQQLHKSGYQGIKLSGPGGASIQRDNPEMNEVYISVPNVYDLRNPVVNMVKKDYEVRFNKTFSHQAAGGYDLIKLLNKVMQGQEITRENIQKRLNAQISYSGIFGNINKEEGEHEIGFPMFKSQIIDGRLIYIE